MLRTMPNFIRIGRVLYKMWQKRFGVSFQFTVYYWLILQKSNSPLSPGGKEDHLLISGCGVPAPQMSASLPPLDNIRVMVIVWRLRKNIIRIAPCWVVWHNVRSQQHTHVSSSYRSSRLGMSHWDPYAMHRGSCLELYYCNMVEWSWWDSSLIWKTNWLPSVLWHCWFGHMACKNRPWYDL